MVYRPDKLRLPNFYRYIQRVFHFQQQVSDLEDGRQDAVVPTETLFEALFLCLLLRFGSFRALEFEISSGQAKKVWRHRIPFSINTLRHGLQQFERDSLNDMLLSITKQMKRGKMVSDTICGLHVAALDGTEYYRSAAIHCPHCMTVHLSPDQTHYVHRAVLLQHVGATLKPFVAAEPIDKKDKRPSDQEAGHEGELTAAKRLLTRVAHEYGKPFIDILTCDALYMNYPFARHCAQLGWYLVARVKDERTELYREIITLSEQIDPIKHYDRDTGVVSYTHPVMDLHLSCDWDIPLHGFKVIETDSNGTRTFLCATTYPKPDPTLIREIVHRKWGIENNGIKDLKSNWHLEHNYHHHPTATWVCVLTLLIVYNLYYAYLTRHMKSYRIYPLTQKQVIREFAYSYLAIAYCLPWARWVSDP
jgi:hypothetical protein|tara:strand:+ start:225 stop:1481 length:1257 start_codon:yes stop_codon:yes gene_type:complete